MKKRLLLLISLIGLTISSIAQPCNSITTVSCGTNIIFNRTGPGNPSWPNFSNCRFNSGTGGKEQIYLFSAPTTGYYQLRLDSASGGYVEYLWKDTINGCDNQNWTCLATRNSSGPIGSIYMNAGEARYIVLNAEPTTPVYHRFRILCGVDICSTIQTISCGTVNAFTTNGGFGDPRFQNRFNGGCGINNGLGGQERIYKFRAVQTGTYQLETTASSGIVEYLYKDSTLGCNNQNWICLNTIGSSTVSQPISSLYLTAGQTIYILLNAEELSPTHTWRIKCATEVCDSIQNINCGNLITYNTSGGYGDPRFQNRFNSGCGINNGLGGQEKIYRLPPSTTGYQITVSSASGVVEYLWKYDSLGCGPTGWNCVGVTSSSNTNFPVFTPAKQGQILLMLNSETTASIQHGFIVNCNPILLSQPAIGISANDSTICRKTNVTLSVVGGFLGANASWKWYAGGCGTGQSIGTGNTITVSPNVTTTFFVRAEGSSNTTSCVQLPITVFSLPNLVVNPGSANLCPGDSAVLTASGGSNFTWNPATYLNKATGSSVVCKPNATITYTVSSTNSNGCANNKSVTVNFNVPIPTGLLSSNITAISANVSWDSISCANGYRVQYRPVGTSTWTTITINTNTPNQLLNSLSPGTSYSWRVASRFSNGTFSNYTSNRTFVTPALRLDSNTDGSVSDGLKAYPNPTNGFLAIEFPELEEAALINVYDVTGKLLIETMSHGGDGFFELDLTTLAPGLYTLTVNNKAVIMTTRIIRN